MAEFTSLHNHTHGSILDGFATPREYLLRAKELGMTTVGITDHGYVTKLLEFLKLAKDLDMKGVPGCEVYVAPINPEGARVKTPVFYGPDGKKARYDVSSNGAYLHLTLWAYNTTGLKNLFKLSTKSFSPENVYSKNRIDFEMLAEHSEGLVVSTGCPSSEISTRFLLDQDEKAYEYAGRLRDVFGPDRLFVEVMNHNMTIDLERLLLPKQTKLARELGLGLLATNDCHYTLREEARFHEEMLCSQSNSRMSVPTTADGGTRFAFEGSEYYLKTAEEMLALFPVEDFPGALSNTMKVAEMTQDLTLRFDPHLRPKAPIPEGFDELGYFKHLINEGYKARYGGASREVRQEAKRRIAHEFKVVHSSDFVGYFLTVHEYLSWIKNGYSTLDDQGRVLASPLGPGRGSVGGSIIAYLLGISELDPIKHDLIFERFLSAGRGATYRITYDDGTSEDLVVSEEKKLLGPEGEVLKYIHELSMGDEVLVDGPAVD